MASLTPTSTSPAPCGNATAPSCPMHAAPSLHPVQVRIWTLLDRSRIRKVWAAELDVAESEISRWASGSRAMSIDDLAAAVRLSRAGGRADIAAKVAALVAELLGGDEPAPVASADASTIASLARAAGAAADLLEDGRITHDERAEALTQEAP